MISVSARVRAWVRGADAGGTGEGCELDVKDRFSGLSSLIIGFAFGGLAMFYSVSLFAHINHHRFLGHHVWWAPADIWSVVDAGRYVWHGALGYAYTQSGSYALPLSFILAAPLAAVIDHFNLVENIVPIARPSAWLVAGPFTLLFGIVLLDAVRRLAWDLGLRRRLSLVQLVTVVIALAPGFEWGHFEDVLALAFVVHALRFLRLGQPGRAGLLLSLAICSKQWAVMLIPAFVLFIPAGRRLMALVASTALPASFVGLVVLVGGKHAVSDLFMPLTPGKNTTGHASFFLTWFGNKTSRVTRSIGTLVAVPAALPLRRRCGSVTVLLAVSSLVLLVRALAEPTNFSYYWSPSLLLAGFVGVAAHQRFRMRDWIWQLPAILWTLPHGNYKMTTVWWAVMSAFLVGTYLQMAVNCGLRLRMRSSGRHMREAAAHTGAVVGEVINSESASAY